MINPKIKICGISDIDILKQLINLNLDYVGFILYSKSPRFIDEVFLKKIQNIDFKDTRPVCVYVNADEDFIYKTSSFFNNPILQFHGDEDQNFCETFGLDYWKAIRIKDENDIAGAVKKVARESTSKQFIVQKLIIGKAVSACVISTGDNALSVTLNRQFVTLASPDEESGYYGGAVPFDHVLEEKALKTAKRAVETVSGLKGYVGVDLMLADEEPVVMEVNPRLTTSYVGLKRAVNFNPAEAISDAVIRRKLPINVQKRGYAFFSKVEVPSCPQIIAETYMLKDVVSPPFPFEGNKSAHALVATFSSSSRGAQSAFYRAKKHLLSLYGGD